MEKIQLCNDELESSLFENVKYFKIAEAGAMGRAGDVQFLTADKRHYQMNYVSGDVEIEKLEMVFPVLKECDFGIFGRGSIVPDGWKYVNLGMGNHLLVRESVFDDFAASVGDFDDLGYVYRTWCDAAVDTL